MLLEDQEETYVASGPNVCPKKAANFFKKIKINSEILSKLPTKQHKGGGLSSIEVSIPYLDTTCLHFQTIIDPILIEKIILRHNIFHFHQAEYTPLAGHQTINSIGFGATTNIADEIMNRTADIEKLTDDPTSLLKYSKPQNQT